MKGIEQLFDPFFYEQLTEKTDEWNSY